MTRALITGITGQDGMYLAEHLLDLGYEVFGMVRGQDNPKRRDVETLLPDVRLVEGDLLDAASLRVMLDRVQPDEVYNLAAISYAPYSWGQPEITAEVNGLGVLRMLDAVRSLTGASGSRAGSGAKPKPSSRTSSLPPWTQLPGV